MKRIVVDKNTDIPLNNDFTEWENFLKEIKIVLEPKIKEEIRLYNLIAWSEIMYKFFDKKPFAA